MAYKQSVIKEIKRKASDGDFEESVKIGAEQKFVSALLNSHNNNLEEQSILGSDCYISSWETENGEKITVQKFLDISRASDVKEGYYLLHTVDKSNVPESNDYKFVGDVLSFPPSDESGVMFFSVIPDGNNYKLVCDRVDNDQIIFFESITTNDQNYALVIRPTITVKEESLYFRPGTAISDTSDDPSGADILISTKKTKKRKAEQKFYTKISINDELPQVEATGD